MATTHPQRVGLIEGGFAPTANNSDGLPGRQKPSINEVPAKAAEAMKKFAASLSRDKNISRTTMDHWNALELALELIVKTYSSPGLPQPSANPPRPPPITSYRQALLSTPVNPPKPPTTLADLIIHIEDPTVRKEIEKENSERIIRRLTAQAHIHPEVKHVMAAKRLPSGDLRLFLASPDARERLFSSDVWNAAFKKARPVQDMFAVMVHGVRTATTPTIPEIIEANKKLHPDLKIIKAGWLKPSSITEKRHSTMLLHINNPTLADAIITRGLLLDFQIHPAAYYSSKFSITQCFQCQAYGHIAPSCPNKAHCGRCAEAHNTKDCPETNPIRCANCRGAHTAWSNQCRVRDARREKAAAARLTAPTYHTPNPLMAHSDPQASTPQPQDLPRTRNPRTDPAMASRTTAPLSTAPLTRKTLETAPRRSERISRPPARDMAQLDTRNASHDGQGNPHITPQQALPSSQEILDIFTQT